MIKIFSINEIISASNNILNTSKKIKEKTLVDTKLVLEEEPLILEQAYEEKPIERFEKKISPAARKMANETNADLSKIEGSGKNGIIVKEVVRSYFFPIF